MVESGTLNTWNWMSNPKFQSLSLNQLKLVGTHDSAAFTFANLPMPGKISGKISLSFLELIRRWTIAGIIIKDWTLTQSKSFYNQLLAGVRVFDLRIGVTKKMKCVSSQELVLSHSFACVRYDVFLFQLKKFILENPSEIVFVTLKHDWVPKDFFTHDLWEELFITTLNSIGEYMYPQNAPLGLSIKVKDLQTLNQRILFNVEEYEIVPPSTKFWSYLLSPFSHYALYFSDSDDGFAQRIKHDIKGRILYPCFHNIQSLHNLSDNAPEKYHELQRNKNITSAIWWMDFPTESLIHTIIQSNGGQRVDPLLRQKVII